MLFDLDNTLIDRAELFRAWAGDFLQRNSLDPADVGWLEEQDGDGLVPKEAFFEAVRARFGLSTPAAALVEAYHEKYPTFAVAPEPETLEGLERLREQRWRLAIVTNGPPMQEAVVDYAGLRPFVDAVCVSAVVGLRKPDPRIFALALDSCGADVAGSWMVGDSATHDIDGARTSGLKSVWISRGRTWTEIDYRPTSSTETVAEAIASIEARCSTGRGGRPGPGCS